MAEPWLVVGLGNPGEEYRRNRHNVGYLFLDEVAERCRAGSFQHQKAVLGSRTTGAVDGARVVLLKPETFMNLSGNAVGAAAQYFKILPQNVVICYDDVDIALGGLRIRSRGSAGGHRGLASVIEHVGDEVIRLRFGIRPPEGRGTGNLAGFVLDDFNRAETDMLPGLFAQGYEALKLVLSGRVTEAMSKFNRRQTPDEASESGT